MPEQCRASILIPAARRAGKTIEHSIARFIPFNRRTKRKAKPHYRDAMSSVVREYQKTQSVVVLVGAESGQVPHAHLVEDGTGPRYTNHKTKYRRMSVRARQIIKNGKAKTVVEKERKSIGSFVRKNKKPTFYRGIMPAYHPVKRGIQAIQGTISQQLRNDIEMGIKRVFTESKLARGV